MKILYTNEMNLEKMMKNHSFVACEHEFVNFKIPVAIDGETTYRNDVTFSDDFRVFEVSETADCKQADISSLLELLN